MGFYGLTSGYFISLIYSSLMIGFSISSLILFNSLIFIKYPGLILLFSKLIEDINTFDGFWPSKDKSEPDTIHGILVIIKLVEESKTCYYCGQELIFQGGNGVLPSNATLDRIDNDYGHNKNNIVISCLDCNIKRKTMNCERFKMGKQLKIIKKIEWNYFFQ